MTKILFSLFSALLLSGCAAFGLGGNPQPANAIMGVLAGASSYIANGCIPPLALTDPAIACAPVNSTNPQTINDAFNACLQATVLQVALANVRLPKCQPVPVPTPAPPVVVVPPVVLPAPPPPSAPPLAPVMKLAPATKGAP